MNRFSIHTAAALAFLAPAAAFAQHFETLDTIPWPSTGRFPAYAATPDAARPTEVWVQAGALYDNNLFRLSKNADARALIGTDDRSETVGRLGAGFRHEQLVAGRQRLRFEGRGDQYAFNNHSELNHFAYGLRGEWLWELTNDLSGAVGYERRQRLTDLAQLQRAVKDLVVEDHAFANGAYRLGPSVRLRAGLDGANGRHTDDARGAGNVHTTSVIGGADYLTPLGNAIGFEARRTQGNYPTAVVLGGTATLVRNDFVEKELAVVATVVAGPQLTGTARVGHTTRTLEQSTQPNFSGTTWRGTLDWRPLQKTAFEVSLFREPRSIIDVAASYVVISGASFGPRWAPTEKLVFSALFLREHQQYVGDSQFPGDPGFVVGGPQRDETVRTLRLGAGWEPKRFIEVSAGFDHGVRTSNVLLRDYDFNAFMGNVRFRF